MISTEELWLLLDSAAAHTAGAKHWEMLRQHIRELVNERDQLKVENNQLKAEQERRHSGGYGASSDADWDAD